MTRFTTAAVLVVLAALPAAADESLSKETNAAKGAKPVTVPFELLKTKHMALNIKVNGKGPYRVIFDTGAPMSVLNNALAKEAGIPVKKALIGSLPTEIKTLEIGDLRAEKLPVIILDHPLVDLMSKEKDIGPLYGIVGFPFFARYKVTIDYKAKRLTLSPNGYDPPDVIKGLETSLDAILSGKAAPQVLAPAAQWGMVAEKGKDDDDAGVTIKEVMPGGAAAAAGLKAGDRLLTLDGRWTDSLPDLYAAAGYVKAGTAVKVVISRDKKEITLTVKPTAGL
jgi:membrane-associated protease RseP (regulator of RpoE activity)